MSPIPVDLPVSPPPSSNEISDWLASDSNALKQQAYAALVYPQQPVSALADELRRLACDSNTQARHVAAVAMGKDPMFAVDLPRLLEKEEHPIVRVAAAHALFRIARCPDEALAGLAAMLLSSTESERKIAEAALNNGSKSRLSVIAQTISKAPTEQLSPEALSAFATAAKISPESRDTAVQWLQQLALTPLSFTIRLGICTALARLTDGKSGVAELWSVVESDHPLPQRQEAMLLLGSLGTLASSCRRYATKLITTEQDEACVVALCRLVVELKTPPDIIPVDFVLSKITYSESGAVIAAICMLLCLGRRSFEKYAPVLAERHTRSPDQIREPLAACYEILCGKCIEPTTA